MGDDPKRADDHRDDASLLESGERDTSQGATTLPDSGAPDSSQGATLPARAGERNPRLPHERDESSDAQSDSAKPVTPEGAQGHEDLERGLVDTDRGPPMDDLYNKKFSPSDRGRDGKR